MCFQTKINCADMKIDQWSLKVNLKWNLSSLCSQTNNMKTKSLQFESAFKLSLINLNFNCFCHLIESHDMQQSSQRSTEVSITITVCFLKMAFFFYIRQAILSTGANTAMFITPKTKIQVSQSFPRSDSFCQLLKLTSGRSLLKHKDHKICMTLLDRKSVV